VLRRGCEVGAFGKVVTDSPSVFLLLPRQGEWELRLSNFMSTVRSLFNAKTLSLVSRLKCALRRRERQTPDFVLIESDSDALFFLVKQLSWGSDTVG